MTVISKFRKFVAVGLSACGGALFLYYTKKQNEKRNVYASWTTNYTPSCEWDFNWDRREPASLVKPSKGSDDDNRYNSEIEQVKPKAVRHIFLIRHGQYFMIGKTDTDKKLTKLGQEQAALTGKRLKELGFDYTNLITSTMTRANETGAIIHTYIPHIPISKCFLLEEGSPIPPEPPVGKWKPETYFFQDGPRIEAAFRKYFHRADNRQKTDSYEIIVCHANVIRYFVCRALQFPSEAWLRMNLHHASITWLSIQPSGRVILRTYSDSGHIPSHYLTVS